MGDPYFDAGIHIDRYYELESDFLNMLKYMPLELYNSPEDRKNAKSIYIADLLLRIGSNIDIIFRKIIITENTDLLNGKKPRNLNINDFMKLNDKIKYGKLSKSEKMSDLRVRIINTGEDIRPFESWEKGKKPNWWDSYNNIKHQANFSEANLDNVINALAAFFILVCIKKHTIKMLNYDYLLINQSFKRDVLMGRPESKTDIATKVFLSYKQS